MNVYSTKTYRNDRGQILEARTHVDQATGQVGVVPFFYTFVPFNANLSPEKVVQLIAEVQITSDTIYRAFEQMETQINEKMQAAMQVAVGRWMEQQRRAALAQAGKILVPRG